MKTDLAGHEIKVTRVTLLLDIVNHAEPFTINYSIDQYCISLYFKPQYFFSHKRCNVSITLWYNKTVVAGFDCSNNFFLLKCFSYIHDLENSE